MLVSEAWFGVEAVLLVTRQRRQQPDTVMQNSETGPWPHNKENHTVGRGRHHLPLNKDGNSILLTPVLLLLVTPVVVKKQQVPV